MSGADDDDDAETQVQPDESPTHQAELAWSDEGPQPAWRPGETMMA
jgi:hypothetical protein